MRLLGDVCIFVLCLVSCACAQSPKAVPEGSLKFDPSSTLDSRIAAPTEMVRQRYKSSPDHTYTFPHTSDEQRAQLHRVFEMLPEFARGAMRDHVRSITFVEGLPGNATTIMEDGSTLPIFDMVLRAGLLNENVSEFLTRKERSYYVADDSDLAVSVEAGSLPAVLYVLLHESVHVRDITNRGGKEGMPRLFGLQPSAELFAGTWTDATTKIPAYNSALLRVGWFGPGGPRGIASAEASYRFLAQTPFVSMYASSNWYDDAAESVTCYFLTEKLHQPYRITVSKGIEAVFITEPMQNPLVRKRLASIAPLFA